MKKLKYIVLSAFALSFFACENEELDALRNRGNEVVVPDALPALNTGSLNLSNYVSVGPSFTAGFTDGGLFIAAQENSFPNILATQFANGGGGSFTQPLMNDNFGGLALAGNRIADPRLVFGGAGPAPLESVVGPVTVSTDIVLNNPTGPYNNLGVPGAKSFHLIANGYGNVGNLPNANPYAVRITGATPNASILELAVAQNPSFFTADLLGGNDVLGYATSGGDANLDQITPSPTFDFAFNTIVSTLSANAQGVVTNIPYVTSLPYFTAVGHDVVPLDQATADLVNGGFATYNNGLLFAQSNGLIDADEVAQRTIAFMASNSNAVVIEDESLTDLSGFGIPSYRQATADDLIVLPASAVIGTTVGGNPTLINGVSVPLADRWVLVPAEQAEIAAAVDDYNTTIAAVASSNPNVALVDVNAILTQASTTGIVFDEFNLNADLVFGGLVSLDGIHLTARGYALMANSFLEAMDANFGTNFVASGNVAKAADYPTNYSPTLQ